MMDYPDSPGHKGRDTGEAAAEAMQIKAPTLRRMTLEALRCRPMTVDEVARALRQDILSIRPRVSELAAMGRVADTGERRANRSGRTAIVWRAL